MAGKALVTGGAGFIGSHLSELLLAERLGGLRPRRSLDRARSSNVAHLRDRARLPPRRRLGPLAGGRQRARAQVRRRLPPGGGGRRPADRRAARATRWSRTSRARRPCSSTAAQFGKRVLVASSSEVYGDHREERPLARGRPPHLRPDDREALAVRRLEGDGRVPRARATTTSAGSTRDRRGSSTPSARVRAASTGW